MREQFTGHSIPFWNVLTARSRRFKRPIKKKKGTREHVGGAGWWGGTRTRRVGAIRVDGRGRWGRAVGRLYDVLHAFVMRLRRDVHVALLLVDPIPSTERGARASAVARSWQRGRSQRERIKVDGNIKKVALVRSQPQLYPLAFASHSRLEEKGLER